MSNITPKPNLQLVYVSDIEVSTEFYKNLLEVEPVFSSPRYVAFSASESGDALFAVWSGGVKPKKEIRRFSEIGIMLPSSDDVDALYEKWKVDPKINIIQEPIVEVFGKTFLVEDPDGHIIRVSPVD